MESSLGAESDTDCLSLDSTVEKRSVDCDDLRAYRRRGMDQRINTLAVKTMTMMMMMMMMTIFTSIHGDGLMIPRGRSP
jgi:hypothetical protein